MAVRSGSQDFERARWKGQSCLMKLAKIRFETDAACARALKGLDMRMRITVLADESFIVPEVGLECLKTEGVPFQLVEWVSQDHVRQFSCLR